MPDNHQGRSALTAAILDRFKKYHEDNPVWGSLHIVLDDNNVEDEFVEFCLDYATKEGDLEGVELAKILLDMTKTQRLKIGRIA